jgi:hypothetical protein
MADDAEIHVTISRTLWDEFMRAEASAHATVHAEIQTALQKLGARSGRRPVLRTVEFTIMDPADAEARARMDPVR